MKVRIISAAIALLIVIPLIAIGGIPFAIACSILGALAYKEILDLKKSHKKIPTLVVLLGLISLMFIIVGNYKGSLLTYRCILLPLVLMLLPTVFYKEDHYTTREAFYLLANIYLVGIFFNLLILIRNVNINVFIYLITLTIATDTFAYAVGCLIGKHKLTKVSPNKSWEGFIAGLIGGTIVSAIVYNNLISNFSFKILIITMLLSVIGQVGDLFYSKIKRENEIKDFSNIMPGHGGILDRLDSLSFVVFAYVILLWTI